MIRYKTLPETAQTSEIIWESSDPEIASVKNGRISTYGVGECIITAKSGDIKAQIYLTVRAIPIESFSVPKEVSVYADSPVEVPLVVKPEDADAASFDWSVADEDVAEVKVLDGKATIYALTPQESTVITVSAKEEYDSGLESQNIMVKTYGARAYIKYFDSEEFSTVDKLVEVHPEETIDFKNVKSLNENGDLVLWFSLNPFSEVDEKKASVKSSDSEIFSVRVGKFDGQFGLPIILMEGEKNGVVEIEMAYGEMVFGFKINKSGTPFTGDVKIWKDEKTPVSIVEEMSRNSSLTVFLNEGFRAKWSSSNAKIATVKAVNESATGYSRIATIKTTAEYGESVITATDDCNNTLSFKIKVSKASFPVGTCIGTMVDYEYSVADNITIKASYDQKVKIDLFLIDKEYNRVNFNSASWRVEGSSCLKLSQGSGSETVLTAFSNKPLSGSELKGKVIVRDDAGNELSCNVNIVSPSSFGTGAKLVVLVNGSETDKVNIGQLADLAVTKNGSIQKLEGIKWHFDDDFNTLMDSSPVWYGTGDKKTAYKYVLTGKKKGAASVTAIDECGNTLSTKIKTGVFYFTSAMKIYYNYDTANPQAAGWKVLGTSTFLKGAAYLKLAESPTGPHIGGNTNWSYSVGMSYTSAQKTDMNKYNVSCVSRCPDNLSSQYITLTLRDDYSSTPRSINFYVRHETDFSKENLILYYSTDNGATWHEEDDCNSTGGKISISFKKDTYRKVLYKFATSSSEKGKMISWTKPSSVSGYDYFTKFEISELMNSGFYYSIYIAPKDGARFPLRLTLNVTDDGGNRREYMFYCHK